MKRLRRLLISLMITALMAAGMPMTAFAKPDWPSDTGIESEAGIVMDADSGAVLFGQNIHVQKAPASITKILTALVVIENSSLDDTITFSHDAVYNVEDGSGNKNAIEEGDTLSVRDCLYLLLMRSSNQAANALAEHVGGSRDGFVKMMNERAYELGCTHTPFMNPHGVHNESHYTTARDLSLIVQAALKSENFRTITNTAEYTLPATNLSDERVLKTTNMLIFQNSGNRYYYPKAIGIKTGYTTPAGRCVISAAKSSGMYLLGIICGAGLAQVAVILSVVMTLGILILDRLPVARAPMIFVVNADNFDAEDAVVETVRKYAKHYRIKSRNLAENSLDLVLELRTDEGGKLVREVMGLAGVTSASLLAHDGEVTF
mgnify:CR=1 FL=1